MTRVLALVAALIALTPASAHAAADAAVAPRPCRSLLVALLLDKSASADGVTEASEADIARLALAVASCGGELAVGVISESGSEPLRRLLLPAPVREPQFSALSGNPYMRQTQLAARAGERRRHADAAAQRNAHVARRINAFMEEMRPVLGRPRTGRRSDVASAVNRGLLFLREDVGVPAPPPRKVLLVVSDGRHNVGPWRVAEPPADVDVRLVNLAAERGSLAWPRVRVFEHLEPAMRGLHID